MTPEQKLKHLVLIKAAEFDKKLKLPSITAENVDAVYDEAESNHSNGIGDARGEIREGQHETGIECEWSRHYESKSVAAQYIDGSWIGWTYWFGGGKHGEPEAIDWMDSAYEVLGTLEMKPVWTFTKP